MQRLVSCEGKDEELQVIAEVASASFKTVDCSKVCLDLPSPSCDSPDQDNLDSPTGRRRKLRRLLFRDKDVIDKGLSVDLWVRSGDTRASWGTLFEARGDRSGLKICTTAAGRWLVRLLWGGKQEGGGWSELQSPPNSCVAGRWTRVTVSCDDSHKYAELYVNCRCVDQVAVQTRTYEATRAVLGGELAGPYVWHGDVQSLAVYRSPVVFAGASTRQRRAKFSSAPVAGGEVSDSKIVKKDLELSTEVETISLLAQEHQWLQPTCEAVQRRVVCSALRGGRAAWIVDEMRKRARGEAAIADLVNAAASKNGDTAHVLCGIADKLCHLSGRQNDGLEELRIDCSMLVIVERFTIRMPHVLDEDGDGLPAVLETLADKCLKDELVYRLVTQRLRKAADEAKAAAQPPVQMRAVEPIAKPDDGRPVCKTEELLRDCARICDAADVLREAIAQAGPRVRKWIRNLSMEEGGLPLSALGSAAHRAACISRYTTQLLQRNRNLHDKALTDGLLAVSEAALRDRITHTLVCDRLRVAVERHDQPPEELLVECAELLVHARSLAVPDSVMDSGSTQEPPSFGLGSADAARTVVCVKPLALSRVQAQQEVPRGQISEWFHVMGFGNTFE